MWEHSDNGTVKAYLFKDKRTGQVRSTPIYAPTYAAAKKKLRRPSPEHAALAEVRPLKEAEKKAIRAGRWAGRKVAGTPENRRGFGPKPKGYSTR